MGRKTRGAFDTAGPQLGSIGARLARAWRSLDSDRRLACAAAGLLLVSMFMPWYEQNAVLSRSPSAGGGEIITRDLTAFGVFSFVEAFILLSALAVLLLLFARAERRGLWRPRTDGTLILIAGAWSGLLLVYRLFDKPGISTRGVAANVGIQWGIFFALLAAGLLAHAGSRIRAQPPRRLSWAPREPRPEARIVQDDPPPPPGARPAPPSSPHDRDPTVLLARSARRGLLPRETEATIRVAPVPGSEAPTILARDQRAVALDEEPTTALGEEPTTALGEEPDAGPPWDQLSFEDDSDPSP